MTVHERFAAWVAAKGWSQHEAARMIGCSQALVSQVIAGRKSVSGLQIAHAIERLSADWIDGPIRTEEWDETATDPAADHGSCERKASTDEAAAE